MLKRIFEIDPRSLGLFRILLGLLLVLYSADRFVQAATLFTDWGIMPRTYWVSEFMSDYAFSFHLANGQLWFQRLLIFLQGSAALAYMIGYRSKLSGFITLILLSSLQSRNNLILSCADDLIRLALLWSLFLPLGNAFGIQQKSSTENNTALPGSVFNAAIMLQLLYIYIFTALLKNHPIWIKEGSAVYYALNIDIYTKPLGVWLRSHAGLMQFATFSTLILEIVGPFVALVAGWPRLIVSLLFISFHMGLFLTLELDFFPWIAAIYWVLFLPTEIWSTTYGQKLSQALFVLFEQVKDKASLATAPTEERHRFTKIAFQGLCAFFLILVTAYNVNSLSNDKKLVPKSMLKAADSLYLYQSWNMFAPFPMRNDGWFVIEGTFTDGTQMNLVDNGPIRYDKPELPSQLYESGAMRKFMVNVWDKGNRQILLPFGRYLCRKYSVENGLPANVELIKILFRKESTPPPGEPWKDPETISLWNHNCFAN